MKYPVDLRHYAKLVKFAQQQGLDARHGIKGDDLIALIDAAFPGITEFELVGADDADDSPARAVEVEGGGNRELTSGYRDDPKVIVNIPTDKENGGAHALPVCVNGDHILIKRNIDVAIPYRFYEALRNAVQTDYRQDVNPATGRDMTIAEQRQAVRFSVIEMPPKAEVALYRERVKNIGIDKAEDPSLKPASVDDLANALLAKLQTGAATATA